MPSSYRVCVVTKKSNKSENEPRFTNERHFTQDFLETQFKKPIDQINLNDLVNSYSNILKINISKNQPEKICYEVAYNTQNYHSDEYLTSQKELICQIPSVYPKEFIGDGVERKFISIYWE